MLRDGTAVPDRSDGRPRLLVATRANHPNSETGRAAVNVCSWKSSVDDVLQRHGTPSQTELASTPEAIWDQQSSGGSSEKYQCTGAVVGKATPWENTQHHVRAARTANTYCMADPNELLDEAEATAFQGWDFSTLGDRLTLEPPDWDFAEVVSHAAEGATTMLDMGTGGGEWLSSLRARPPITVATEGWQPNVAVARARLSVLGVPVVYTEGAPDNHRQVPGDTAGRLPFRTETFDLVTNRHESFRAKEVARVLRCDGIFLTQQTHSGSRQFHELLGNDPPDVQELELDIVVVQLRNAGLSIDEAEVGTATTVFADIGALAWYLRSVPWAVPGFTVERVPASAPSASPRADPCSPSEVLAASPQIARLVGELGQVERFPEAWLRQRRFPR